jgi:hypothetical protein
VRLAGAPALSVLADGMAVAGAGEITWLDTVPADAVGAAAAPDADDGAGGITTGTSSTNVWVVVGAAATGADVFALTTDVADGPRVGKFGVAKACEAVPPWPADGSPILSPRLDATGAPSSMTATREPTATAPLIALIAAVSFRRRRERLGLTWACPP